MTSSDDFPCHAKPRDQWCDHHGADDFMGHTCAPCFVTPAALPTEHERELLTIFIEECAEAQQRATKLLRFGRDEVQPGQTLTNSSRLAMEVGDVAEMIERLILVNLIQRPDVWSGQEQKRRQLRVYMQTAAARK